MPFKHNAARRHRILKARYRIQNWPTYEAGLKRRGGMTLWIDEMAVTEWAAPRRESPSGQRLYSDVAIGLVLILRLVFHLALRQAEAFGRSGLLLFNLDLAVPDHTPLSLLGSGLGSQRPMLAPHGAAHLLIDSIGLKLFGQGEWHAEKHGRARPSWRKLHLAFGADTGEIVATMLSDSGDDYSGQVSVLLRQVAGEIASVTADGGCDGDPVYQAVVRRQPHPPPTVVNPPRSSAVLGLQMATRRASAIVTSSFWRSMAAWAGRRPPATAGAAWSRPRGPLQVAYRSGAAGTFGVHPARRDGRRGCAAYRCLWAVYLGVRVLRSLVAFALIASVCFQARAGETMADPTPGFSSVQNASRPAMLLTQ